MLPKAHRKIYENNTLSFFILYFLQGIPFSLQTRYLPLVFRKNGMAIVYIALYKLAIVPWTFKIIWAPLSAVRGNAKRKWLICSLGCLAIICLILSRCPPWGATCFTFSLILYNVVASLSDVALDTLVDEVSDARRISYTDRVQFAGNCAGALSVGSIACITELLKLQEVFSGLAVLYFIGFITSTVVLPYWETPRSRRISISRRPETRIRRSVSQDLDSSLDNGQDSYYSYTIKFTRAYTGKLLDFDGSWWILTLLSVYKIGEQGVKNVFPLYLLEQGYDISSVGFWTALFAQSMSIAGSVFGFKFRTRIYFRAVMIHMSIRAVFICALWFSIIEWQTSPGVAYVCSLISFSAIFFISASMTSCIFQMILRVSQRAPQENRRDLFDLLMTADILGKVFLTAVLGGVLQFTGFRFVGVFGVFVVTSAVLVPLFCVAPTSVHV